MWREWNAGADTTARPRYDSADTMYVRRLQRAGRENQRQGPLQDLSRQKGKPFSVLCQFFIMYLSVLHSVKLSNLLYNKDLSTVLFVILKSVTFSFIKIESSVLANVGQK